MDEPNSPVPSPRPLSRRRFVAGSASLAAAAWLASCRAPGISRPPPFSAYPFSLGVASGEPDAHSVILWTRLAPQPLAPDGGMPASAVPVGWQVAEDENMSRIVRSGTATAEPRWGHSVHVEVTGLQPDRWYWYRFTAGSETSPKGRTRTMPPAGSSPARLRFAFASCQHYETGLFTAFEHMAREDLDLIVHLGDYIYEGAPREKLIRRHAGPECVTLDDYRIRYAQYKTDPAVQAAHAAAPWIVTWDDHEVANNYAADIPQKPVPREEFLRRRAAAYQTYYEMLPLRRSAQPKGPDLQLYRQLEFGQLATFFVLDTRQYRTDQPCGDGTRPPCDEAMRPDATLLGRTQREWLFGGLEKSRASWNILAQQVMMAPVDRAAGPERALSMDQWPGYEFERRNVLRHFRDRGIRNPVILSGDIHTNWANELLTDFDPGNVRPVAVEFVGTAISSGGDGAAEPKNLAALLEENPFVKFHNAERGYVRCEATPQQWRTDFQTVPFVTRPGAPLQTRATFLVDSGQSRLRRV
jgi:alkaline phosphatase D